MALRQPVAAFTPSRSADVFLPRAVRLLGVRIDCLRLDDLLIRVAAAARLARHMTVLYVNVHCMNVAADDAEHRNILEQADIVYCDGEGVRLGSRLAGQPIPERMTGADWIGPFCSLASREGMSLFLLGGQPGAADEAAAVLEKRFLGLCICGTASGYETDGETIKAINACRPDILLVGMGTPVQEKWIARHRAELDVPVVWAVGALFDFVAGRIRRGPGWMTQHGLEWLCRLAVEPRKLWRRYLVGNPRFLARVVRHRYLPRPTRVWGRGKAKRPALIKSEPLG